MPASKPRVIYQHEFKKRRVARKRPPAWRKEELSIPQILAWADNYHLRTGRWPKHNSGHISPTLEERWSMVNAALHKGLRGLPKGNSLPRLLAKYRGVRNPAALPPFTLRQILVWADAHYKRTGLWPIARSGPIAGVPGETWRRVDGALQKGHRGLPGSSTLAQLLAARRGVRNIADLPPFDVEQILLWADAHHRRTGKWPNADSGPVPGSTGETWMGVETALRNGTRGFTCGSSLARLLADHRGVRNLHALPRLSPEVILTWADAHRWRTGKWPIAKSGPVFESPEDNWQAINADLKYGLRGLPGGPSLARFLALHRGVRNRTSLPRLSLEQILLWSDDHYRRTGKWPKPAYDSPILASPAETWGAIDAAMKQACRGFPAGYSLARLLAERRGVRNVQALPRMTPESILDWADNHRRRTGEWPITRTGPIHEAPGETWVKVDKALALGRRGLPGGSTLIRLLAEHRRASHGRSSPRYRTR